MSMDEFDIFDDEGELLEPTMRGSANLDTQDYQGWGGRSGDLDDELQEDVPSTPGRNPGAAPATDLDDEDEPGMTDAMDQAGMRQTTYGSSPWGPGSGSGYRPFSQQRTGMELRALGDDTAAIKPREKDSMHHEPEVIDALGVEEATPWGEQWHGMRNPRTSNADVDPLTIYDRDSYEYDDSSQNVIGSGIFAMEEGVTWRPRDGSFAHQYAMPAYLAAEDEMGVQQSEMWDSTAAEWRVTQPSAGGVTLARRVRSMKPSPFRPEVTGPRSHIEAFGRKAAHCILAEAAMCEPRDRAAFLVNAIEALGPGSTARAKGVADRLQAMGYPREEAFEDALAHLIMHAAAEDLTDRKKGRGSLLPRLDRMSSRVNKKSGELRAAASKHLAPLSSDRKKLSNDLGALYHSPAAAALGEVTSNGASEPPVVPAVRSNMTRNLLIAGGVGLGAYLLFANRKAIKRNLKKLAR
jgi:hypothetical protein